MDTIAVNRRAYFDYEILETYEAGIVLTGSEVKSVKSGHVQLKGSFISIVAGKALTENLHISPYKYSNDESYSPLRRRQLLLKKKEIDTLAAASSREGYTLIPLEIFQKQHLIKILVGVCRGKKAHDKRDVLKKRAIRRDINQGLKNFSR